jgi:hypothetical protein
MHICQHARSAPSFIRHHLPAGTVACSPAQLLDSCLQMKVRTLLNTCIKGMSPGESNAFISAGESSACICWIKQWFHVWEKAVHSLHYMPVIWPSLLGGM